jgi:tripartite-type tricarboxylate transporter receptor subunit TctC
VPFAAGGLNDVVARLVAPYLERSLGQPFIVDNRPAASGIVGTDATAKAPPDGYTLLMVASSFTALRTIKIHVSCGDASCLLLRENEHPAPGVGG